MRISSILALLTLAGCGQARQEAARAEEQRQEAAAPKFPCARGSADLRPDCTAERTRGDKGWLVTLRHPDGHFRRILVRDDDSVRAADGAEAARVTSAGNAIEIAIAGDRYRLPRQ